MTEWQYGQKKKWVAGQKRADILSTMTEKVVVTIINDEHHRQERTRVRVLANIDDQEDFMRTICEHCPYYRGTVNLESLPGEEVDWRYGRDSFSHNVKPDLTEMQCRLLVSENGAGKNNRRVVHEQVKKEIIKRHP